MADLIAGLEGVVRKMEHIKACGWNVDPVELNNTRIAVIDFLRTHHAEIAAAVRDKRRMDWLEGQREAYGFENEHHGNRWVIDGPFRDARQAIDTAMRAGEGEG